MPRDQAHIILWSTVLQAAVRPGPRHLNCVACGFRVSIELPALRPGTAPRTIAATCGTCAANAVITLLPPPELAEPSEDHLAPAAEPARPPLRDRLRDYLEALEPLPRIPARNLIAAMGLDPNSTAHAALVRSLVTDPAFATRGGIRWQLKPLRLLGAPRSVSAVAHYIPTTTAPNNTAIEEGRHG